MHLRALACFSPAPEQGRTPSTWMSWNHPSLKVQFRTRSDNYTTTFITLQLAKRTCLSAPNSCTGASVWKTSTSAAVTGRRAGRSPALAWGTSPPGDPVFSGPGHGQSPRGPPHLTRWPHGPPEEASRLLF